MQASKPRTWGILGRGREVPGKPRASLQGRIMGSCFCGSTCSPKLTVHHIPRMPVVSANVARGTGLVMQAYVLKPAVQSAPYVIVVGTNATCGDPTGDSPSRFVPAVVGYQAKRLS